MRVAAPTELSSPVAAGKRIGFWKSWGPTAPLSSPATACGAGLLIGLCMLGLAIISFVRAHLDGTLASDRSQLSAGPYAAVVAVVGICCAVSGYLYMRAWGTQRHASLERLLLVALAIHCCAFPALPLTGDDIFVNLANGRLLATGLNPYQNTPADLGTDEFNALVSPHWFNWITPYGPINTWSSWLAVSPGRLWPSIWAFKTAMFGSAIAVMLLAYGFCRTCLPPERRARSFVLLAWNPLLAWELSAQAHNDGPMLVCATAFVWAAFTRREWLSSALLITAFYAKFAVAPVLGLHLCYRARNSWWRAGITVALAAVAGVCLYYPFWYGPKTLTNSLIEARSENWHIINSFVSFACDLAGRFGPAARLDTFEVWSVCCRYVFLGLAAYYAWRATSTKRVIRDSLVFLLLFETIGKGWFFPWYVTWLLPLAMADEDERLQNVIAAYSILVELTYIPSNIGAPIAHGIAVLMLWNVMRSQRRGASQPDEAGNEAQVAGPFAAQAA